MPKGCETAAQLVIHFARNFNLQKDHKRSVVGLSGAIPSFEGGGWSSSLQACNSKARLIEDSTFHFGSVCYLWSSRAAEIPTLSAHLLCTQYYYLQNICRCSWAPKSRHFTAITHLVFSSFNQRCITCVSSRQSRPHQACTTLYSPSHPGSGQAPGRANHRRPSPGQDRDPSAVSDSEHAQPMREDSSEP